MHASIHSRTHRLTPPQLLLERAAPPMAAEGSMAPASPRLSASSPPTVGTLLTRAGAPRGRDRGCSSPRSLLSRILHRSRGAGFGCRLRLLPRYCASGAAAKVDVAGAGATAGAAEAEEQAAEVAAPTVVAGAQPAPRESPRTSLGKKQDALPASLGLGASLVLLLSKSAAELSRMAELRAQMERLLLDAKADIRSCNGRPSASGDRTDCASVVKGPVGRAGDEDGALSPSDGWRAGTAAPASESAARRDMDRMEAELEAELLRLQVQRASDNDEDELRDDQLEVRAEPKSSASSRSQSHSAICSDSDIDNDGGETDNSGGDESENREDDEEEEDEREGNEMNGKSLPHGGVSARELERRLHQLLQSRHEARIAELESALERARRKLRETEREACRWRDTAKLATRFADESRLR